MTLAEQRWLDIIHVKKTNTMEVLSLCGPSGVGKTTVIKVLAKKYPAFIETTVGNPHLKGFLEERIDFNAAANQEWFLRRIGRHISRASLRSPLILDQDPAAIVLVYSRIFLEDDMMTGEQYDSLLERLLRIEHKLHGWKCPRTVLFLDAPAGVLRQRIVQRNGNSDAPPLEWFKRVRRRFTQLSASFPNAITMSTVRFSAEQVVARAKSLVEDNSQGLKRT
jgi:deoxyadenosine/deoxycytidine kinase